VRFAPIYKLLKVSFLVDVGWLIYCSSSHCSSFLWQQVYLTFSCQSYVSWA